MPIKHFHRRQAIASGVDLRILPLGDSITWGEGSSDENGYRLALATLIKNGGNNVEYIGSVKSGAMPNNENEGHGGFQILPVGVKGKPNYPERPNVILLMAGANDIIFESDIENAPQRMGTVIGEIVTACPDAAVLIGTLLPLLNPQISSKTIGFNTVMMGIVWDFTQRGKKVALIDMGRVTASYIRRSDGIHPTDEGYALIAAAWHDGIVEAGKKGWIQRPLPRHSQGQLQGQPNETSISDDRPPIENDGSQRKNSIARENTWILAQLMIYALILFGLVLIFRRIIISLLHRYR